MLKKIPVLLAAGLLAGCGGAKTAATTTAAPETTATRRTTAAPAATTTAAHAPQRIDLNVTKASGVARVRVKQGRRVVLHVTADVSDEVHVHGYDLKADVAPGKPATIAFRATIPGRFVVELEHRSLQIAELQVS